MITIWGGGFCNGKNTDHEICKSPKDQAKRGFFLIRRSKQSWKQPVGGSGNESDEKVQVV